VNTPPERVTGSALPTLAMSQDTIDNARDGNKGDDVHAGARGIAERVNPGVFLIMRPKVLQDKRRVSLLGVVDYLSQLQFIRRESMRIWSALPIIVMFAVTAVAADVNGKWIAQMKAPNGSISERVFTFKVAGDKLTGTIANRQVAPAIWQETGKSARTITLKTQTVPTQEISEGKISGNEISFVLNVQMQGQPAKNLYTGKISGDEIVFSMETKAPENSAPPAAAPAGARGPQQIVAKKAGASD
jgi:hypothetical protein